MTEEREWERWQQEWQGQPGGAPVPAAVAGQIAAARRQVFIARLIEGVIAAGALGITALALEHPVNAFEAALGLVVGTAIGIVWIWRALIRRNEDSTAAASSIEHLALIENVRRQQRRLAPFLWLVVVLEA